MKCIKKMLIILLDPLRSLRPRLKGQDPPIMIKFILYNRLMMSLVFLDTCFLDEVLKLLRELTLSFVEKGMPVTLKYKTYTRITQEKTDIGIMYLSIQKQPDVI